MTSALHDYYLGKPEPVRSCLLALRGMILAADGDITETQKWGMPCFCYRKKVFCYLWTDKKTTEPYLLMVEGRYLNHPGLEEGARKKMKIFRVDPGQDIPMQTIGDLLDAALQLYQTGVLKSRP